MTPWTPASPTPPTSPRPRAAASVATRAALLALAFVAALPRGAVAVATVPDGFADQLVAAGLEAPVGMAFLPDGRLLVVEQRTARVRLVRGPSQVVDVVGTVPGVNSGASERGLLGIAVDPGWPARPYVYVHYTATSSPATTRLARFTLTGDVDGTGDGVLAIDVASRHDLITDAPDVAGNHNGGSVRFAPDGMLLASFGEDATPCAAQDTSSLRGVVLRLDVSGLPPGAGTASKAALAPADNPFVASPNLNRRLTWALGLRNPFRIQVDAVSGEVFVGDVGQDRYEEISRAGAGGLDFGWPFKEGPADFFASCPGFVRPALTPPIFWYDRDDAGNSQASVIVAGTYRPRPGAPLAFPAEYTGDLFASDYFGGMLWRLTGSGDAWSVAAPVAGQPSAAHWAHGLGMVSDYAVGPDGALWYCRQASDLAYTPGTGQVRRIAFTDQPPDTLPHPPPPPPQPEVQFGPAFPVPSAGSVRLDFTLSRAARVTLTIHDLRGRRARVLLPGTVFGAGAATAVVWDGKDDAGRDAPNGVYFARLDVEGQVRETRLVLVR